MLQRLGHSNQQKKLQPTIIIYINVEIVDGGVKGFIHCIIIRLVASHDKVLNIGGNLFDSVEL